MQRVTHTDRLRQAWQTRHESPAHLSRYATELAAALAGKHRHPHLDAALPASLDAADTDYRRTLRRDCCSVARADGARVTVFYLAAWFGSRGRTDQTSEAAASKGLEESLNRSVLAGAGCRVVLSRTAGDVDWLKALTPRSGHKTAALVAEASDAASIRRAVGPPRRRVPTWGTGIFQGVRLRSADSRGADYFDRLDPTDHVRAAHGAMQPAVATSLRDWADDVSALLGDKGPEEVSWPSDRDGALAAAAALNFSRQESLERSAAYMTTAANRHAAMLGGSVAFLLTAGSRSAGPIIIDVEAMGLTAADAMTVLADKAQVRAHASIDDISELLRDRMPH